MVGLKTTAQYKVKLNTNGLRPVRSSTTKHNHQNYIKKHKFNAETWMEEVGAKGASVYYS